MKKPRRRRKPRGSTFKGKTWPLYITEEELGFFNHVSDYVVNEVGVSMSHLIRRLLQAWERNEVEGGKKEPFHRS